MSLISEHRRARTNRVLIVLHEFRIRYKKQSNFVYGFVEGKDDVCFYRGFIEQEIPEDWGVEIWWADGKDNVFEIYSKLDWRRFKKDQVVFFVDRDLIDLTKEKIIIDRNIYITDYYSIENNMVNYSVCDRILREICGFSDMCYRSSDAIRLLFEEQLEIFQKYLIPLMSITLYWKVKGIKICLNDIQMKHLFKINRGVVRKIERPKGRKNIIDYASRQCNAMPIPDKSLKSIQDEWIENYHYKKYCRGKYLFWFLIEFCLSLFKKYNELEFINLEKKPKMNINLSHSNSIVLIGPRVKMPNSLKVFFANTICKYTNHVTSQ